MLDRNASILARIVTAEILPVDLGVILVDDQVVRDVVDLLDVTPGLRMVSDVQYLRGNVPSFPHHGIWSGVFVEILLQSTLWIM
jgi:hypothetical protein